MFARTLCLLSLASLTACGSSAASSSTESTTPVSETPVSAGPAALTFARAIALAAPLHASATPFVVEREREDGRDVIEVKLLEGSTVYLVKIATDDESIVEDETRPSEGEEAAELTLLTSELASRPGALQHGLDLMIAQYGEPALHEVEMEMHGTELVLEAAVMEGASRSVRVHDPADGHYLMTEN